MAGKEVFKVIWAVDPFAPDAQVQRTMMKAILAFARRRSVEIEPVYVLDARIPEFSAIAPDERVEAVRHFAGRRLRRLLPGAPSLPLRPLRVIDASYLPMRERALMLSDDARRKGADVIAVSTHSRGGLQRWIVGSFAETLLHHSEVPVLVINPCWVPRESYDHVLFPTDLSEASEKVFERLISLTNLKGASLTVFHKADNRSAILDEEMEDRQARVRAWCDRARGKGLEVRCVLDYTRVGGIAEAILAQADQRPGLIAMASRSTPIAEALLGSVTQSVVRASPYAIWVLHPPGKELSARKAG